MKKRHLYNFSRKNDEKLDKLRFHGLYIFLIKIPFLPILIPLNVHYYGVQFYE